MSLCWTQRNGPILAKNENVHGPRTENIGQFSPFILEILGKFAIFSNKLYSACAHLIIRKV